MAFRSGDSGDTIASTIVKEGWLLKADPSGKNWKNRWCVLIPSAFFYYSEHDKKDANLKGSFELAEAKLGVGWRLNKKLTTDKQFIFHLSLPGRTYYFAAATQAHMNDWVAKLEKTLAALQKRSADDALAGLEDNEEADMYDAHSLSGRKTQGRGMPSIVESEGDMYGDEDAIAGAAGQLPNTLLGSAFPRPYSPSNSHIGFKNALAARYQHATQGRPDEYGGDDSGSVAERGSTAGKDASRTGGARVEAAAPPPPPTATTADDTFTFHILAGGAAYPGMGALLEHEKRFTMVVKASKKATFTMGHIKRKLAQSTGLNVADMVLTFDQDHFTLDDDVTAEAIDLGPDVPLRLQLRASPKAAPAAAQSSPRAAVTATATAAPIGHDATVTAKTNALGPLSSRTDLFPGREKVPSTSSALPPIEEADAEDAATDRPPSTSTDAPAVPFATNDIVGKRHVLREIFRSVAANDYSAYRSGQVVPDDLKLVSTDVAGALAADARVVSWPEYDHLIRKIIAPEMSTVSFNELSDIFREVQVTVDIAAAADRLRDVAAAEALVASRQPEQQNSPIARSPQQPPHSHTISEAATAETLASASHLEPAANEYVKPRQRHVMVMSVDVPNGVTEDINVSVGSKPEELANAFITKHGLNRAVFEGPLTDEIRKVLLDAYALELRDAVAARDAADRRVPESVTGPANATSDEIDAIKNSNAALVERMHAADVEIATLRDQLKAAEASQRATEQARQAAEQARTDAEHSSQMLQQELAELKQQISANQRTLDGLKTESSDKQEEAQRKDAWARHVSGEGQDKPRGLASPLAGSSFLDSAVATATASLDNWRTWATEKRDILARANADRAALIEENKRLRAALDIRGVETEARLRSADEDRARLSSEVHALTAARHRAEAELRSVYRQWEEDGRRWAGERKQLTEQVESLLSASIQQAFPSMPVSDAQHADW